jgi:hypothetical protein
MKSAAMVYAANEKGNLLERLQVIAMRSTWDHNNFHIARGEALQICAPALQVLRKSLVGLFLTASDMGLEEVHPDTIAQFGTGCLVEYRDRFWIATCGHVLESSRPPKVFLSAEEPLFALEQVMPSGGLLKSRIDDRGKVDVGFLEVSPDFFRSRARRFYRIQEQFLRPKNEEALLFSLGYLGKYSGQTSVTKTPSGIWLPQRHQGLLQSIPTASIPLFEVRDANAGFFKCVLDVRSLKIPERSLLTHGCSGGPIFRVVTSCAFEGDSRGLVLAGFQSHQGSDAKGDYLLFQTIFRWRDFVDQVL